MHQLISVISKRAAIRIYPNGILTVIMRDAKMLYLIGLPLYAIIQHQRGKGVESGMTDYCMCYGEGCKDKEICYRYRAKPTPGWQSYFKEQPGKDRNCGQFLRN